MSNMRFTALVCALISAGCAESTPNDIGIPQLPGDAVLDNVIASIVLRDVDKRAPSLRADRRQWYWAFDWTGIADVSVASTLEQLIRLTAPATSSDTVNARARNSVDVRAPEINGDSALVSITYKHSWENDCSWYHSSSNHQYVFGRRGGIWRFIRDNENVIGDPAPPPPPGTARVCYGRGGIR